MKRAAAAPRPAGEEEEHGSSKVLGDEPPVKKEAGEEPTPSAVIAELRQQLQLSEEKFKKVCDVARRDKEALKARNEYLEELIDTKVNILKGKVSVEDELKKKANELEEELEESQLRAAQQRAEDSAKVGELAKQLKQSDEKFQKLCDVARRDKEALKARVDYLETLIDSKDGILNKPDNASVDNELKEKVVELEKQLKEERQISAEMKKKLEQVEAQLQQQPVLRQTAARIEHTLETIKVSENDAKNADSEVRKANGEMEKLENRLKEVMLRLQDVQSDTIPSERERRKNEACGNLMRVFPDKVYGRLLDLCAPSQKRFNLAAAKVFQKHMNSIVCDTDTTAREAIAYLKEQRYETETFLPLSMLDVQPINERLRSIKKPHGAKLLYDVIQCPNNTVKKAVQYACGDALVVEDAEGARYLAHGEAGERHKAVALDGTLFNPSGLISGGGADLKRSARRWDDAAVKKLKGERAEIVEKLKTIRNVRMKKMDIEMKK